MSSHHQDYVLQPVPTEQREQWDSFMAGHCHGHMLQSWAWGELKARYGWHPLRLALRDRQQRIVAAAQVLRRTAPHIPLRSGHLAYIPKGPVLDWSQPEVCAQFLPQLSAYIRRQGAITLRMEPGLEAGTAAADLAVKYLASAQAHPIHPVQPLRTISLDLAPTEETLLAQMKEKWRYNIRLAARKGVSIREAETIEDLEAWYNLLQVTGTRDKFGIHTFAYYVDMWRLFKAQNALRVLLAEHNGQLLAGIFVGHFASQAAYMYGASSNEQRQLMPNYLLQWEAIRWAKQQGADLYDFWGIPDTDDPNEAMAGVYRFKSGWGGRVVKFIGGYEQIYRQLMLKIATRFI
ncbi:peptidoglycan bridge formation glycyltransferase FemA/FemB family protein [Ktedonosporobacter rubrisoli]|uniref:Peptidoglycan bridge formation glycyltransferase FemA/FemB family protein n=1 Tax=Ktedonosporobacter rubrisoli TaxID=2509675 RepID=A0A4P6JUR5_KTERU|nr:peptidoglycan bridge formation glycyltransferase FemA/FemB family protein [Ktedonosporobacter rubrisoli]QBD79234.1 peptidoglycan bridge formation glycyltransferase FemA/FemB family protein [Ktedonosporobacter rubrisoli]